MYGHDNDGNCRSLRHGEALPARKLGLLALLAAGLVALAAPPTAQGQESASRATAGFVYTADERGNSISAIDLAAGTVETVPVPISPHNVQVVMDGTRLLAVGSPATEHGHSDEHGTGDAAGRLLVLDPDDLASGPVAEIAVGSHPAHVVADREGRRAFVTNAGDDTLSVIDLVRNETVGTVPTGDYPHGLRMSPDGREIYVANVEDGSLSVIDTARLVETARIPVGKAPVQVGFTPDGSRVYASLRDENRVAVIDTATRTVSAKIEVGRNPIQLHATPDGRLVYVANQGTEAEPADTVSVVDAAAGTVVDTIRTGSGAHGVTVSDDGAFVFVSNLVEGTVSVLDTAARRVTARFAVGAGPNGITFRPASSAAADHEQHHPAQAGGAAATDPSVPGAGPAGGMAGMPGMTGMMMPEMMETMQGMMAKQGGEPGQIGMTMCPTMRDLMEMTADPQAMTDGSGMGPGALYGMPPAAQAEMTPERVRAWLEVRLAWHGNPRLKIGEIAAAGAETITAEIVTTDGSLVQKLAFNRHPGLVRQLMD